MRLIGIRSTGHLVAGLAGVFALVLGGIVAAAPALAADQHVCKQIGAADSAGNTAIVCSDLIAIDNGDGTFYSNVKTEAYCENSAKAVIKCNAITISNEAAYQSGDTTFVNAPTLYQCGGSLNPVCPSGRYIQEGNPVPQNPNTCIANTWGVTLGSGEGNDNVTSITLPSNTKITLSGNYATPHTSVGNC